MKSYNDHGYVAYYLPTHHRAKSNGTVYEHILVAEEKLGRPLKKKECVHHIDENKKNNDPDNLMVFVSNAAHTRFHKTHECTKNEDGTFDSKAPEYFCERCGKKLKHKTKLCLDCYNFDKSKHLPSKEELLSLLQKYEGNFTKIGNLFDRTDNVVRKWCKKYGLPFHTSDYKPKKEPKEKVIRAKPVNQLDLTTGEIINTFPSAHAAARHVNKKESHIGETCRGIHKSAYGYGWEYANVDSTK